LAQLDAELNRLPDTYRVPVILCELEGKTRRQAARILGLPEGTVSSRLAQARKLLAKRLARHGMALSGGALAAVLAQNAAQAGVPPSLLASTAKAGVALAAGGGLAAGTVPAQVVALTEGVVKAMLVSKLKLFSAVGVVLAVAVSAGAGLTYRAAAQGPEQARFVLTDGAGQSAGRNAPDDLEAIRLEMEALRKEVRALRERVKTLEAQAGAPKGGGQTLTGSAPRAEGQQAGAVWHQAIDSSGSLYGVPADPLAEAEAALKKLRQNPNDNEATDALGRALQQMRSRGLRWWQQPAPSGGGGLPPGANPGAGAKAGQSAPTASADAKTPPQTVGFTFEGHPVATAEAALQKLRSNPADKQASEALERAMRELTTLREKVEAQFGLQAAVRSVGTSEQTDPLAQAEGALQHLKRVPGDQRATEYLEQALKGLREQRRSQERPTQR
jgi:hypothetical protein